MKKILGLDLGTNSIGWSVINEDEKGKKSIIAASSRILPFDSDMIGNFEKGNKVSATEIRTQLRGARRLRERFLLRRERLLRVLAHIGFLPKHYADKLDRYGKFVDDSEPKIAWDKDNNGKNQFLFMDSFNGMASDFKERHGDIAIPHDWTLYYLRAKATKEKISKEELSWVLLSFLQKRGYNPTAGLDEVPEDETNKKTREFFLRGKIKSISDTGRMFKDLKVLLVELEDGTKGKFYRKDVPNWIGEEKTIIAVMQIDKEGNDKMDNDLNCPDCKFQIPTDLEWDSKWALLKKRTEQELRDSGLCIGEYIYNALLSNPSQKIIGKLVRVVDRELYENELNAILTAQCEFHPELKNESLYKECIELLYASNEAYRQSIARRGFVYLIKDDIILYQRPLKVKKNLISDCQFEKTKDSQGNEYGVKCIARSHPLFEEFRLWQWVSNVKILQKGNEIDVTNKFISDNNERQNLFEMLKNYESIDMKAFLKLYMPKGNEYQKYRWNYVEDKSYPCCNTNARIVKALEKAGIETKGTTDNATIESLWHILYSVSSKKELEKAMKQFCVKHYPAADSTAFASAFIKIPAFVKEYGSYSAKAIKRLLPLMRCGDLWNVEDIDTTTMARIKMFLADNKDASISERAWNNVKKAELKSIDDFQGLPLHLACYIVYDRSSETQDTDKWESPADIDDFVNKFKQHSLNNPIVEQVTLETLRVVRDLWNRYGKVDEIHIEMGRELKQTSEQRKNATSRILENETANRRAKALLLEFKNPEFEILNVRPNSPSQMEIFRIFENDILESYEHKEFDSFLKMYANADSKKWPSKAEVKKYRLWLEQKYRSPYTGNFIPLSRLFTSDYQIEHVIPQARYFDDSFTNKVVCEAEVNLLKSSQLGYEFICNHHGQNLGKGVEIFSVERYEQFVNDTYGSNKQKMKKMLAKDIPDVFNERQMNDTRYISKLISSLLSKIVREEGEDAEVSKNIVSVNGSITTRLKKDWGLNDVWNQILLPRFERLNNMMNVEYFTAITENGHRIPQLPFDSKLDKKRLDHRHHAMDAIVIACATRNHVNLINNLAAKSDITRYDLQKLLRKHETYTDENGKKRNCFGDFLKPWDTFTEDAKAVLSAAIVSFKYANRILTRTSNHYQKYEDDENGNKKKKTVKQSKGDGWAIRNSLHKDTVFGKVNLQKTKEVAVKDAVKDTSKIVDRKVRKTICDMLAENKKMKDIESAVGKRVQVYCYTNESDKPCYATRKTIDTTFDKKKILEHVTDTGIQKILLNHLEANGNNPNTAFSPEGIEEMNSNIVALNGGVQHQPIYKVRYYEASESKFSIGTTGNKKDKFVEGDKGSNAFYAIYTDKDGKRSYRTVTLNEAISRMKDGKHAVEDTYGDAKLLFYLQPMDIVYLPTEAEREKGIDWNNIDRSRIYKFVSSNNVQSFFTPFSAATAIVDKMEFESLNKMSKAITGEMIKEFCVKIKINRIGEIEHD
ncbi:MAG: type II CRISPR RNA-guided endonuclease Cas9 [Paludibacteraceae bacterium]|nr:type II CRISPR RNA-guided endonuclease Cas9 [Paludibacteraceae bacterium]